MRHSEKVRRQRIQIKSDDQFARDYLHELFFGCFCLINRVNHKYVHRQTKLYIPEKAMERFLGGYVKTWQWQCEAAVEL